MATPEEALSEAHDAMRSDPGFQFELPDVEPLVPVDQGDQSAGVLNGLFRGIFDFFVFIGPFLQFVFIFLLIALVIYVLWSIFKGIQSRQRQIADGRDDEQADLLKSVDVRPDAVFAEGLLARADELAAQGQYAEALRLLLRHSFSELQNRVREKIGVSFTAREIGRMGSMPDVSRGALNELILQVELSAFAQQPVDKSNYEYARQQYQIFAFGEAKS